MNWLRNTKTSVLGYAFIVNHSFHFNILKVKKKKNDVVEILLEYQHFSEIPSLNLKREFSQHGCIFISWRVYLLNNVYVQSAIHPTMPLEGLLQMTSMKFGWIDLRHSFEKAITIIICSLVIKMITLFLVSQILNGVTRLVGGYWGWVDRSMGQAICLYTLFFCQLGVLFSVYSSLQY